MGTNHLNWKGKLRTGEHITGVNCPRRFCDGRIVYSGNYFCEFSIGVLSREEATCDFILESDEYEQAYQNGKYVQYLAYPAPPLHKRVWNEIRKDLGLDA